MLPRTNAMTRLARIFDDEYDGEYIRDRDTAMVAEACDEEIDI